MNIVRITLLMSFLLLAFASDVAADGFVYAGIIETYKGEGVFVLEEYSSEFPSTPDAWGGAIAEFRRRHPSRRVIATLSVAYKYFTGFGSNSRKKGIVIITEYK